MPRYRCRVQAPTPSLPIGAPPPRKRRGCLIAAIVAAVVVGLPVIGLMVLVGPHVFAVTRATRRLVEHGKSAPGVKELEAKLCAQAMVLDLDEQHARDLLSFPDAGPRQHPEVRHVVACFINRAPNAPTCEQVASSYRASGKPVGQYNVVVRVGVMDSTAPPACSQLYAADHAALGDVPPVTD